MPQFVYFGDAMLFQKLKQLYSASFEIESKKKKKKPCLENISFMFKENHFQFPPKSNKHGTNSQCGTNVLFERMKVFKNIIGILTWNGDEYFPSQTLTLFDLNRTDSIVHVLELTEDEMITEKIVDFQIGDDFVLCQTESSELYFIGLYQSNSNRGINYYCEQILCEKLGKIESIKSCSNKILLKSVSQHFYIAEVKKLDQTPTFRPIESVVNNTTYPRVKDVHFGEFFNTVLTDTNQVFSIGRFIVTNDRYGFDWIPTGPTNLYLPTSVTNLEQLTGDNHSFLVKDSNANAKNKYYIYYENHHWSNVTSSVEQLIGKSFPNETITIDEIIPNPAGIGYLALVSFNVGCKRLILFGSKAEHCPLRDYLEPLNVIDVYHVHDFPSYFYSVTGFDEEFEFEKCHFTNNFVLFEMEQSQNSRFVNKLLKNSKFLDIDIVTQNIDDENNI